MAFCTNQWTGLCMIRTSVMKELTPLNNKFYKIRRKEFSRSRIIFDFTCIHFNIYECLKWLENSLWLINIKFYDIIVTDMFHKYRIRSPKVFLKWCSWQFCNIHKKASMSESFIKKVAGNWLIKKRLQHSCFLMNCVKCFEETLQVAVDNDSTQNKTILCFVKKPTCSEKDKKR